MNLNRFDLNRFGISIIRRARPTRKCYWVAIHFPTQWQAEHWLKERATAGERIDARQLQTGDRIRHCDI